MDFHKALYTTIKACTEIQVVNEIESLSHSPCTCTYTVHVKGRWQDHKRAKEIISNANKRYWVNMQSVQTKLTNSMECTVVPIYAQFGTLSLLEEMKEEYTLKKWQINIQNNWGQVGCACSGRATSPTTTRTSMCLVGIAQKKGAS